MKLFISWSGNLSHRVALILKKWLEESIHHSIDAFVSSVDVAKGTIWSSKIAKELEESQFGIICVTKENIAAPWIYFEAGALYANKQTANATPFLVDVDLDNLQKEPFREFMVTRFDKEDVRKLVSNINSKLEDNARYSDVQLNEYFENVWWKKLEGELNGLLQIYSTEIQQEKARDHYCNVSEKFIEHLRHIYQTRIGAPMDRSDLWYIIINTIDFKNCKDKVISMLDGLYKNRVADEVLYDISVWSLLGEAELLIKFRAGDDMARNIERRLFQELSGGTGAGGKSLLESTNLSPSGMAMINIALEMVRNESSRNKTFKEGRFIQSKPIPRTLRSIKVFIRLRYEKGHDLRLQNSIQARLAGNIDSVESIAFTSEPPEQPGHIIAETHFPCGHFDDLSRISSDLESELFHDLIKETYLAYDVKVIDADSAEVVSGATGSH